MRNRRGSLSVMCCGFRRIFAAFFVGALALPLLAATVVVPSPQAKSIGAAMAVARPGDTVKVKDGVYKENIFVAPAVVLVAENLF